jgi:hypothetical protein
VAAATVKVSGPPLAAVHALCGLWRRRPRPPRGHPRRTGSVGRVRGSWVRVPAEPGRLLSFAAQCRGVVRTELRKQAFSRWHHSEIISCPLLVGQPAAPLSSSTWPVAGPHMRPNVYSILIWPWSEFAAQGRNSSTRRWGCSLQRRRRRCAGWPAAGVADAVHEGEDDAQQQERRGEEAPQGGWQDSPGCRAA